MTTKRHKEYQNTHTQSITFRSNSKSELNYIHTIQDNDGII